jgi:hypothetical protein
MTQFYTASEVSARTGAAWITAQKWAEKNIARFVNNGKGKTYLWTEADIERFKSRPHAGRPPKDRM